MGTRVTRKGQVTIPKPMRDRFGIRLGSLVDFRDEDGRLVVVQEQAPVPGAFDLPHPFPGWNWEGTTEEFMEMTRGEPDA